MQIPDIKLHDVNKNEVFCYLDDENTKIERLIALPEKIKKNSGYYLITGCIKIADGTVYPAILGISSDDSGELFEAYFFVNKVWVSQMDQSFLKKIHKKNSDVAPYKYHLNVKVEGDKNTDHQF